jgi:hypothetical protein
MGVGGRGVLRGSGEGVGVSGGMGGGGSYVKQGRRCAGWVAKGGLGHGGDYYVVCECW